ncbi:hypothetical protein LIA77_01774 [Sarocladium implicatum]|nr:hypothetical protein LIA77_01774 [Sarocladium implicatum]
MLPAIITLPPLGRIILSFPRGLSSCFHLSAETLPPRPVQILEMSDRPMKLDEEEHAPRPRDWITCPYCHDHPPAPLYRPAQGSSLIWNRRYARLHRALESKLRAGCALRKLRRSGSGPGRRCWASSNYGHLSTDTLCWAPRMIV